MRLLPLQDGEAVPEPLADPGRRCVVLYWLGPPPAPIKPTARRRSVAARPTWTAQVVRFEALGMARPPSSAEDLAGAVRLAYAFAASHHPIPSAGDVYYEIRS